MRIPTLGIIAGQNLHNSIPCPELNFQFTALSAETHLNIFTLITSHHIA